MKLNNKEVNTTTLEIDGVDFSDYPDFCDAHFSKAEFANGTALNDSELAQLTDEYGDVVSEMAFNRVNEMADFA